MRGKVALGLADALHNRITPAYAGKSGVKLAGILLNRGSPPPMRGKARTNPRIYPSHRITPAYAGKRAKLR